MSVDVTGDLGTVGDEGVYVERAGRKSDEGDEGNESEQVGCRHG